MALLAMNVSVDLADAVRLLATGSGLDATDDAAADVARLVGCEPAALGWAGTLARTLGWRPLRQRLTSWPLLPGLLGGSPLPWGREVERVQSTLSGTEVALLATLAACDAPFTWDVLESVEPAASIESICRLEEAGLLVRSTRAGVVAFAVPYCVRALERAKDPTGAAGRSGGWLDAWVKRAEELRRVSYGTSAEASLAELAFSVPLAERALVDEASDNQQRGLALWTRVSDAMFFAFAIEFGSSAFACAVAVADRGSEVEPRIRARLVASRALLEQGEAARAEALLFEAIASAGSAGREDLLGEALRGLGWAQLASAQLEGARSSFDGALAIFDAATDPRGRADAVAGLGILALLTGDLALARARLEDALAIHVLTRDAPREGALRGMMGLLPDRLGDDVDVGALAKEARELRTTGQGWRLALLLARLGVAARARGDVEGERRHLAEARVAAGLSRMSASAIVASLVVEHAPTPNGIVIGIEGRSLVLPSGESHDLTRHGPTRKLLWALAVTRRDSPGASMSTLDLVDAGWPGEKMKHEAATLRVYTTVRRLRALGLSEVLLTRDDGYLLDPDATFTLENE